MNNFLGVAFGRKFGVLFPAEVHEFVGDQNQAFSYSGLAEFAAEVIQAGYGVAMH